MKKLVLVASIVMAFLGCPPAFADSFNCLSSGSVMASCAAIYDQNPVGTTIYGLITVAKVASYSTFIEGVALSTINKSWCPGEGLIQMEMMNAIVSKFLRDHPEQWGDTPVNLTVRGLATAFPCKRSK